MGDTYQFWGIVLSEGEVTPANKDFSIYYTQDGIQNNLDGVVGTDIRLVHLQEESEEGETIEVKLGEVVDYATLEDNVFVLNEIEQDLWDDFVESFNDESSIISIDFKQLTEEIDAGNLALSAGLKNVGTLPTPAHDRTVAQWDWKEVSIVPSPASPGAWAWGCDEQCRLIFGDTMTEQEVEIQTDPSDDESGGEEVEQEGEVQTEPRTPDTVQMGGEEFKLVPTDEIEQSDCNCETEELKQQLTEVKQERDQYESLVEEFRQQRREEVTTRIEQLNSELPDEKAYEEEKIEQMCEDEEISHLEQQADLMERLVPEQTTTIEQSEEDLSGTSSGTTDEDEKAEKINNVSQDLFGKDLDEVLDGIGGDE